MDWNGSSRPLVSRLESSLSFLYSYNYDPYPGELISTLLVLTVFSIVVFFVSLTFHYSCLRLLLQIMCCLKIGMQEKHYLFIYFYFFMRGISWSL
jgi:hypothetical protein